MLNEDVTPEGRNHDGLKVCLEVGEEEEEKEEKRTGQRCSGELYQSGAYYGEESMADVAIGAIVCFAISALEQRILLQPGTGWS